MRRSLLALFLFTSLAQAGEALTIDVHRDANCGCCKAWIDHLQDNGFTVNDHVETDMSAVKQRLGVPPRLASCHTGVIDGKFVEGHVPATDILKLRERVDLIGAAVPGMPMGSPGMEYGDRVDAYQVIGLDNQRQDVVLSDYPGN
uniref:Metal-binding protein n=1 Tax=Ectopseudomonas mendocina (strain ymp) TaxID=399739 RepID=A4XQI1_ECTM1